jgi:hypothetical protein
MSAPTLTPDRQTFRAVVAQVAAAAKAKLPAAVNGRLESAVKLVLAHDVTFLADGTVEVGSSTDPLKTYTLAGQACDCQDFAYGQAPEGWCQHRIAAGIAKRVQEQLGAQAAQTAQAPTSPPQTPVETSHAPDALQGLGEAPASANVRVTIAGREVQVTLRDTDEARLLERLQVVLERYPVAEKPTAVDASAGFCHVHGVQMKHNDKNGRQWWSHRLPDDQGWCKGRRGR